jgi:hypothetical protein
MIRDRDDYRRFVTESEYRPALGRYDITLECGHRTSYSHFTPSNAPGGLCVLYCEECRRLALLQDQIREGVGSIDCRWII